jgi:hypothetical protein
MFWVKKSSKTMDCEQEQLRIEGEGKYGGKGASIGYKHGVRSLKFIRAPVYI